jgi:hypothetical protein
MGRLSSNPNRALEISQLVIGKTAFVLLLGRPGLKFGRHCPQSPSDPEIKGGSGHGNKNFCLLTQVCTTDHDDSFGKGALFQVSDIAPISFRKYLGKTKYLGITASISGWPTESSRGRLGLREDPRLPRVVKAA